MSYETVETLKGKKAMLDKELKLYLEGKRGPYVLSLGDIEKAFGDLTLELDKFETNYERGRDPEVRELADGSMNLYKKFKGRRSPENLGKTELEYIQAFSVRVGQIIDKKSKPKYGQNEEEKRLLTLMLAMGLPFLGLILAASGAELMPDSAYSGMVVAASAVPGGGIIFGALCGIALCAVAYVVLRGRKIL